MPFIFVTCISLYNFSHYLTIKMCVMGYGNDQLAYIPSGKFLDEKHYHYLIYQFGTEGYTQRARPVQGVYP